MTTGAIPGAAMACIKFHAGGRFLTTGGVFVLVRRVGTRAFSGSGGIGGAILGDPSVREVIPRFGVKDRLGGDENVVAEGQL